MLSVFILVVDESITSETFSFIIFIVSKIDNEILKSIFIIKSYSHKSDRCFQVPFQIYNKYDNYQRKH